MVVLLSKWNGDNATALTAVVIDDVTSSADYTMDTAYLSKKFLCGRGSKVISPVQLGNCRTVTLQMLILSCNMV